VILSSLAISELSGSIITNNPLQLVEVGLLQTGQRSFVDILLQEVQDLMLTI
jgi:hypothetical protein